MIGLFLLFVMGVIVCQRIVQRHIFLLQKQTLVQEFHIADLSTLHGSGSNDLVEPKNGSFGATSNTFTDRLVPLPYQTLHLNDVRRLQNLGLLKCQEQ